MNIALDTLIARLALSLFISSKRVQKLPTVQIFDQYQTCDLVPGARCGWGTARDPMNEAL
jgi:hypothetical protein